MNYCVDIGNSRLKLGVFEKGKLKGLSFYSHDEVEQKFYPDLKSQKFGKASTIAFSNVGKFSREKMDAFFGENPHLPSPFYITHESSLPLVNKYATPETLGMDRIVAGVGCLDYVQDEDFMLVDAGTAVTYEFVRKGKVYEGGGISPGIKLRFKSLNQHTSLLPLVNFEGPPELVGNSTKTCIQSGVIWGLINEVQGHIYKYKEEFGDDLKILICGGDADFLGNHLKHVNFVAPNLVLEGINRVIEWNK